MTRRPSTLLFAGLATLPWRIVPSALVALTMARMPALAADDCTRECGAEATACVAVRCDGLRDGAARACRETCRGIAGCTRVRTLAYAVSECRTDASGTAVRQSLVVRRGSCAPVTVIEFPFGPPVPESIGLCEIWGRVRNGISSVLAGAIHRLAVSPDGSGVVFEVNGDLALFPLLPVPAERSGIYHVRPDGGGLRRLAPPSRLPTYQVYPDPRVTGLGLGFTFSLNSIAFTPDGRRIAYADLGPGVSGEEAPQIVVVDITSGVRTQITRLPPPPSLGLVGLRFVGDARIGFATNANPDGLNPDGDVRVFTVGLDGAGLDVVPEPVAPPGATVDASFQLVGNRRLRAATFSLPGTPVNPRSPDDEGEIAEAFVFDRRRLLQLTNFRRRDTLVQLVSPRNRRIFLTASADPFGANPSENCQIFSVDPLGRRLRQLTRFEEAERSTTGCSAYPEPGCVIWDAHEDVATGSLLFYSSCDPLGAGFFGGNLFAMRSSGGGLRQVTRTRGMIVGGDGSVSVEMPGPWALAEQP